MILLEDIHPALLNALERMIRGENVVPHTTVKDFDGTELLVLVTRAAASSTTAPPAGPTPAAADSANPAAVVVVDVEAEAAEQRNVTIEITIKHIVPRGILDTFQTLESVIRSRFPSTAELNFKPATNGGTISLTIPPKTSDDTRNDLVTRFSQLRAWCYIPLFKRQFELFLGKPDAVKPIRIPYHPQESLYIYNSRGNFIVLVSVVIDGRDERVFAKNFLQTFQDAKKLQKEIAAAPGFVFTQQLAPNDVPSGLLSEPETDCTFWCQFQLQKSHMEGNDALTTRVITNLVNFRNYLLYHIHCCRSYMHALMRKRVENSLLVLNRSKTSTTGRARVVIK